MIYRQHSITTPIVQVGPVTYMHLDVKEVTPLDQSLTGLHAEPSAVA